MLLYRYTPKTTADLVGNKKAILGIKEFLAKWKKGMSLLVHGQPGSGKSSALKLLAKELGYQVMEVHGNEKIDVKKLIQSSGQQGVFFRKKVILVEDIDTKAIRGIGDLIKKSSHPVICTAADAYKVNPPVRKLFKLMKFEKIRDMELLKFAEKVCEKEKIGIEKRNLEQIVKICNGDVRSLLIDIDAVRLGVNVKDLGYRNIEDNVFNTIRLIFKTMSIDNTKIALEKSEKDAEEIFHWLEENIKEEYDLISLADAYDYLSKADVFYTRIIRRQSWSLQKYFSGLAVYGTALAKKKASPKFVAYRYPRIPRRISPAALEKLSRPLHTSRRKSVKYLPVVKMLAKSGDICEDLGMDEKETASILG